MPAETEIQPTPDAVKINNESVIGKLAAQGADTLPESNDFEATSALDALRETKAKEKDDTDTDTAADTGPVDLVVEKKAADAPAVVVDDAAQKLAAEKKAAEDAAANEIFKGIELPSKASPRSAEAFASLKTKAAQELSRKDEEIAAVKAKLEEADRAKANPLTPEVEKELSELREFRAKVDVEADPKFKAFDAKIESASDFIFSRLKADGAVTDEHIKQIKGYGGLLKVEVDKILDKVSSPATRRLIENRLAEIEQIDFEKSKAIASAKENLDAHLANRLKENEGEMHAHNEQTKKELDSMMANLKWLAPRKVESGAKEEDKKAIENHNAFVSELQKEVNAALTDDSAKMRATLLIGTTQLLYLQRVHQAAIEKMAGMEKQLKEANEFITKYRKSAGSGLKESAAPPSGKLPTANKGLDLSIHPTQSIDDIARQVMEERRAKLA